MSGIEMTERDRLIGGTMATRYVWYADRPDAPKPEDKPEYESLIDEDYYSPEYQENPAVLDDVPADHEPDTWKQASKSYVSEVYKPKPFTSAHHFAFKWDIDRMNRGIKTREEYFANTDGIPEEEDRLRMIRNADDMLGIHIPETFTHKQVAKAFADRVAYIVSNYPPEPDFKEAWEKTQQPATVADPEPEHQEASQQIISLEKLTNAPRHKYSEIRRQNKILIEQCSSLEQVRDALLTLDGCSILTQADYMRIHVNGVKPGGINKTDEEFAEEIARIIIERRERKAKAKARKPKYDNGQQLTFGFEEDKEHEQLLIPIDGEPIATPAKKKTRGVTKPRRRSVRRRKYDDSQQIAIAFEVEPDAQLLISFVEEVTGGEVEQREAA